MKCSSKKKEETAKNNNNERRRKENAVLAFDRRALSVKLFFLLSYSVCYVSVIVQRCRLALNTIAIEKNQTRTE